MGRVGWGSVGIARAALFVAALAAACAGAPGVTDAALETREALDAGSDASRADVPCAWPLVRCGGRCVDTRSDVEHCGACASACDAPLACVASACACASGVAPCTDTTGATHCPSDASFATDEANCGICGRSCASGEWCGAGGCVDPDALFAVRVLSATVGATSPDGVPWDPDGSAPDLLVEVHLGPPIGTVANCGNGSPAAGATPIALDTTSATWTNVVATARAADLDFCLELDVLDDDGGGRELLARCTTMGGGGPVARASGSVPCGADGVVVSYDVSLAP